MVLGPNNNSLPCPLHVVVRVVCYNIRKTRIYRLGHYCRSSLEEVFKKRKHWALFKLICALPRSRAASKLCSSSNSSSSSSSRPTSCSLATCIDALPVDVTHSIMSSSISIQPCNSVRLDRPTHGNSGGDPDIPLGVPSGT